MSTCRSCGAKIKWIKTAAGKNMPVDPEPVSLDDAEDGWTLINEQGEAIRVEPNAYTQDNVEQDWYISHFATCPNADQHRSKR